MVGKHDVASALTKLGYAYKAWGKNDKWIENQEAALN
jgi:hypothetical protein